MVSKDNTLRPIHTYNSSLLNSSANCPTLLLISRMTRYTNTPCIGGATSREQRMMDEQALHWRKASWLTFSTGNCTGKAFFVPDQHGLCGKELIPGVNIIKPTRNPLEVEVPPVLVLDTVIRGVVGGSDVYEQGVSLEIRLCFTAFSTNNCKSHRWNKGGEQVRWNIDLRRSRYP